MVSIRNKNCIYDLRFNENCILYFTKDRLHLVVPLRIWENVHSIYFLYTCSKLLVSYVMTRPFLLDTRVFSLYVFRWQHLEITSERLFNNTSLGSFTISNFSCKLFIVPFYAPGYPWVKFFICQFQYSVDNLVSFLFFSTLKYFLWFG